MSWSPRVKVGGFLGGGGLARMGPTSAVATWYASNSTWYSIFVRRSTSGGTSWGSSLTLSTFGTNPAVAALDPYVDVVWEQANRIAYSRSVDSGQSYSFYRYVSPKGGIDGNPSVARGPNGLVAIAWQDEKTNIDAVKVSTDGGVTFGPLKNIAATYQGSTTAVAVGDGVVYVAYQSDYQVVKVTRSTDGGATWSTPMTVSTDAQGSYGELSIVAAGTHVYFAYNDQSPISTSWGTARYRRSLDSGVTWSAERQLSPTSYKTDHPQLDLYGGTLRAVYTRKVGSSYGTYYEQSTDGLHWSTPESVDANGIVPFVTDAGNVIVLFENKGHSYVRTGS